MFARPSGLATTRGSPLRLPPRLLRLRVTPAFRDGRHRPPLGVRLEGRTGNLPSSGLAPDQFASGSEAAPLVMTAPLWRRFARDRASPGAYSGSCPRGLETTTLHAEPHALPRPSMPCSMHAKAAPPTSRVAPDHFRGRGLRQAARDVIGADRASRRPRHSPRDRPPTPRRPIKRALAVPPKSTLSPRLSGNLCDLQPSCAIPSPSGGRRLRRSPGWSACTLGSVRA